MEEVIEFNELIATIEDLKSKGHKDLPIAGVLKVLTESRDRAASTKSDNKEERARSLEAWKVQVAAAAASSLEMFKAVLEAGQTAVKAATLINAGAAAALLAVIAETLKNGGQGSLSVFLSPLGTAWLQFMAGLWCAALATAARYVSQALYAEALRRNQFDDTGKFWKAGGQGRNVAIAFGAVSFVFFAMGAVQIWQITQGSPHSAAREHAQTSSPRTTPPLAAASK